MQAFGGGGGGVDLLTLSFEHQQYLNLDITHNELEGSLQHMKLGKASGPNGLSVEFYKSFKDKLLPFFQELLNFHQTEGVVPAPWREARLVLIPKEGNDHKYPTAYAGVNL